MQAIKNLPLPRVVVIGAGGLGTAAVWALVEGWNDESILEIDIWDPDKVEISNLHRQVFFRFSDIPNPNSLGSGGQKAEILAARLSQSGAKKSIRFRTFSERVTAANIKQACGDATVVLECTDSPESKFLVNDFCVTAKIAFCYAGAIATEGLLFFVNPSNPQRACLRCLFGNAEAGELEAVAQSCATVGIFGPVAGFIGGLQGNLALRFVNESSPSEVPQGYRFSATGWRAREFYCPPSDSCPLNCGKLASFCEQETQTLDLRAVTCPNTFLYTKLALEELETGYALDVRFGNINSAERVEQTIRLETAYTPSPIKKVADSEWQIVIRKQGDNE